MTKSTTNHDIRKKKLVKPGYRNENFLKQKVVNRTIDSRQAQHVPSGRRLRYVKLAAILLP